MPLVNGYWKPLHIASKHQRVLMTKGYRYRALYGGRSGGKDWAIASVILEMAVRKSLRVIFTREVQNTIAESIHQLLCDRIHDLGLDVFYHITKYEIIGSNGTSFTFKGLRDLNAQNIKSFEGADICVVIEAQDLSEYSWKILDPTIRKPGSEIWLDFNTGYEDDFIFQRFVVNPPENAIVEHVNFTDNPWASEETKDQAARAKAENDPDYDNIWLGLPKKLGGRVWSGFVNKPDPDGHIREFPWDILRDTANCFMAIDPHQHYYPAALWVAIIPKNTRHKWPEDYYKYVYNEFPSYEDLGGMYHDLRKVKEFHGTLLDLSREILRLDGSSMHGLRIMKRMIDPRFAVGSGSWNWANTTEGIVSQWHRQENGGLEFNMPRLKILDGILTGIKQDLSWNSNAERSVYNEPSLYVAPWCKNVIASLNGHRYEEQSERESEKYKDFSDALKMAYAGLEDWSYKNPLSMSMPSRDYQSGGNNFIYGSYREPIMKKMGAYGPDGWMS